MKETALIIESFLFQVITDWKAKQKMDLSPDVFCAETLNNNIAFGHNVGLPSREPDNNQEHVVRPFRGIKTFYFKLAKTVTLQMILACRGRQGVR